MEKDTGKVGEKSGNFVSPEKWEPCSETESVSSKCFRYLRHLNFNSSLRMVLQILLTIICQKW